MHSKDYFRVHFLILPLPTVSQVRLSASGDWLAYVREGTNINLHNIYNVVLLSNRILAVTNQGTYFVWDTSYDILPLSQFICFESFRFISFKFKFRAPHHMLRLQCPLNRCVHV